MGGFFGIASQTNCVEDLFFGTDYHSHLGTKRGGLAVIQPDGGFVRTIVTVGAIKNIESLARDAFREGNLHCRNRECAKFH